MVRGTRAAVHARKEVLLREANERVLEITPGDSRTGIEIICECGDETCLTQVLLSRGEYETVRGFPTRFVVAPHHEDPAEAFERVVEEHAGYYVVEKLEPAAADRARRTDPRR
jgi:hypothetical protein